MDSTAVHILVLSANYTGYFQKKSKKMKVNKTEMKMKNIQEGIILSLQFCPILTNLTHLAKVNSQKHKCWFY